MPPLQKLIGIQGLSKQTAKGAGASTPATFGFGVKSGHVFNAEIEQDYESTTLGGTAFERIANTMYRSGIVPVIDFTTYAYPRSLGLLLYGALGGIATVVATPNVHTITPAMTLPYLTAFGRVQAEYTKLVDAKVASLKLSWSERSPVEVEARLLGVTATVGTASFTTTNDETQQPFYGPIGGTLQLDTGSTTPATAKVTGASIEIASGLEAIMLSASVVPDDVYETEQSVIEGTITVKPTDLTDWKKIFTGTGAGTTPQATAQLGSFSLKLANISAITELTLSSGSAWFMADFPESDTGGAVELELAFKVTRPTDATAPFTAIVENTIAAY